MYKGETGQPVEILLVEDNDGDVRLTQEALKDAKIANRLHVVPDGESAMDYLLQRGRFVGAQTPDLVLLDLNLPRKDGREVLAEVKQHPTLRSIPVVVLTSSQAEVDILRSYDLHANCYITKPVSFDRFIEVVQSIEAFWLAVVKLPSVPHHGKAASA